MSVVQVAEIVFVVSVMMIAAYLTFTLHPMFVFVAFVMALISGIVKIIHLVR